MLTGIVSRRTLLRTGIAGALSLCARKAFPDNLRNAGSTFVGKLSLHNVHTTETLEVSFRNGRGRYDPDALDAMDRIFRCHYTQEVARIDIRVIEYLFAVSERFGGGRSIDVISGYRSREYNDLLLREGRGVVPGSLHMVGKAIDFRIPGIDLAAVRQAALDLKSGGVGYYPASRFVHIDCGRIRSW